MIPLSRRYQCAAAHVLRQPSLSDAENERIYGKCANPNGHGHNYGLEVTITGPVSPDTGQILELERTKFQVKQFEKEHEYFRWAAFPALALLLLELGLGWTRLRVLP